MTEVEEEVTANQFSKINTVKFLSGFTNSIGVLIIIVTAGYIWRFDDQHIAQFSQAIGSVIMCAYFYLTWHYFGKRRAVRAVPERESLATAGFKQMIKTGKGLVQYYRRSMFLFFIGVCFTSAGELSKSYPHVFKISICIQYILRRLILPSPPWLSFQQWMVSLL